MAGKVFLLLCFGTIQRIRADTGHSGCGDPGYLTSDNGTIKSHPHYGELNYGKNEDCTWRIEAPVGMVIHLTSDGFDIESGSSSFISRCNYDFLNIYDGTGTGSKSIGSFCGHKTLPIDVVSSGRQMFLEFITDGSTERRGFLLRYHFEASSVGCGTFEFMCPNRKCIPNSYLCDGDDDCHDHADEVNCTLKSTTSAPRCSNGEFECTNGRCIISRYMCDGDDDCGDRSDETHVNCGSVTCSSGQFQCRNHKCISSHWHCDGDHDCTDNSDEENCHTTHRPCLFEFTCANHNCVPHRFVCDGDDDCHDGSDERNCSASHSPHITIHCRGTEFQCSSGTCIPRAWMCDGDNDCRDNSDEAVCGHQTTGLSGCGSTSNQNGSRGIFNSMNYPGHYVSDANCRWDITVPDGDNIEIRVNSNFHLEGSVDGRCSYDRLVVYDADTMIVVNRLCGDSAPGPITVHSNRAIVEFVTDSSTTMAGFQLTWMAVNESVNATAITSHTGQMSPCNRDIHYSVSGSHDITSPNYGNFQEYPPSSRCVIRIFAPQGQVIRLHFNNFGLEGDFHCRSDALVVYDGQDSSGKQLGNFCGNNIPPDVITNTNKAFMLFISDAYVQNIGFNLTYSIEKPKIAASILPTTTDGCHGSVKEMNATTGMILSEGYDGVTPYPDKIDCKWRVVAPVGKAITLSFEDFELENSNGCMYDYLKIYDGQTVHAPLLKSLCSKSYPDKLTSTGSNMYLRFHTDDSTGGVGFKIQYTIHDVIPTCSPVEYTCKNGTCVSSSQVCDGNDDCGDGSDEVVCGSSSTCGSPAIHPIEGSNKIVGGREAVPNSWPWMASLQNQGDHTCGGALIHPQFIVTAAHCFDDDRKPNQWEVGLGKHHEKKDDPHQVFRDVLKIIIHEDYDTDTNNNDISLMKLDSPVILNNYINVPCLPTTQGVVDNEVCYSTGFGEVQDTCCAGVLKQASLPIVNLQKCNSTFYLAGQVTTNMICAGYEQGGTDSCQGDSGGPFVCKQHGKWYLQGITSWGIGCADAREPGAYTKVLNYVKWIQEHIAANS